MACAEPLPTPPAAGHSLRLQALHTGLRHAAYAASKYALRGFMHSAYEVRGGWGPAVWAAAAAAGALAAAQPPACQAADAAAAPPSVQPCRPCATRACAW